MNNLAACVLLALAIVVKVMVDASFTPDIQSEGQAKSADRVNADTNHNIARIEMNEAKEIQNSPFGFANNERHE